MQLLVDDNRIHARLTGLADGRERIVIDYPDDPKYRAYVRNALAGLLRAEAARQNVPLSDQDGEPTRRHCNDR